MKRKLLLSAALIATLSVFPQNSKTKPSNSGKVDVKSLIRYDVNENGTSTPNPVSNQPVKAQIAPSSSAKTSAVNTWTNFSSSSNIYGVLISYCKPLQYNDELNAVSFIHRKPASYVASPAPAPSAANGLMVVSVSSNLGNTWDSTLIWSDNSNWARYPGGAIYNPPGNSTLSAAYYVGAGPTTAAAGGWPGNFYASKQLNVFNNVASTTPNAQQWMDIANPNPNVGRHDFAAYGFSSTDDGKVRVLAGVTDDGVASDSAVMLITGSFNSGVFSYSGTMFHPLATIASDGSENWLSRPIMAWNEAGTVGYVAVTGQKIGATGSNAGPQPLVWKTTNSGASWASISEINFNNPAFDAVKRSLPTVGSDSTLEVPWFSWLEGMDMVVDKNDKLHLFASVYGAASNHPDSVFYLYSFGSEGYRWPHTPGFRPYLYDFMTDGTSAWTYMTIDSMETEGPAGLSTGNGFNYNPWDLNGADKTRIDARLQMSRTPDGKYIYYSWAESDTNFTSNAVKWNVLPNIKVKAYSVDDNVIANQEYNITSPPVGANPAVASRAMYHYMSPKSTTAQVTPVPTLSISTVVSKIPFTLSNSPNYTQLASNSHWYNTAELTFTFATTSVPSAITEAGLNSANASFIYPNPAKDNATLAIELKNKEKIILTVYNLVGQVVTEFSAEGQLGQNLISLNLADLKSGIYMVNVNVGNAISTKKLIIE